MYCPGNTISGANSLSGCSTNRRWCARGCGRINKGELRVSLPKAIKSKSNRRGSLRILLDFRPNSCSNACRLECKVSGVSSACGRRLTTAFTNGREPGGQFTGVVRQREDLRSGASESCCSRTMACRRISTELPRFEPSEITACEADSSCSSNSTSCRIRSPSTVGAYSRICTNQIQPILVPRHPACRKAPVSASPPKAPRAMRRWQTCRGSTLCA